MRDAELLNIISTVIANAEQGVSVTVAKPEDIEELADILAEYVGEITEDEAKPYMDTRFSSKNANINIEHELEKVVNKGVVPVLVARYLLASKHVMFDSRYTPKMSAILVKYADTILR